MNELCQQLSGYFPQSEKVWFQAHGIGMEIESRLRQQCFDGTILAPNPSLSEALEVIGVVIIKVGNNKFWTPQGTIIEDKLSVFTASMLIRYTYKLRDERDGKKDYKFVMKGKGNKGTYITLGEKLDYNPDPTIAALELLLWLSENKLIGEVKSDTADVNAKYEHFQNKVGE